MARPNRYPFAPASVERPLGDLDDGEIRRHDADQREIGNFCKTRGSHG